jgi:hypothetical protein
MTTSLAAPPAARSRVVPVIAAVWFILAVGFSAAGGLARLPFPWGQLVILALTAAAILAVTAVGPVRAWVDSLSVNTIVGFHAIRLVGVAFLVLGARGLVAPEFATRAGWGDVAAALGAIALVAVPALRTRWLLNVWNVFGLLDLIVAVGTATIVVATGRIPGMEPILRLPLSLVPLFFVPVLVASHIALFRRINAR